MLKINKLASNDYYKKPEYIVVEDYMSNGIWKGTGALKLNLFNTEMKKGQMESLADGVHPLTENKICKKDKSGNPFQDYTLSATKYFSSMYFLDESLGEKAYQQDIQQCVNETVSYIESLASARINSKNEKADGKVGLVYVQVNHETARPTKEKETKTTIRPDFQIHFHLLVWNRVVCEDGVVRELRNKEIYFNQKVAGAYFRKMQAKMLRKRGFEIEKCSDYEEYVRDEKSLKYKINSFKIKGISEEQMLMFSNRKKEIDYLAFKYGTTSNKGRDRIACDFRSSKILYDRNDLIKVWRDDAKKLGLTNNYIQSLKTFKKNDSLKYLKTDENIFKYVIRNDKVYKRDILIKLHELSQFIDFDVNKKLDSFIKSGMLTEIAKNTYKCNIDLSKEKIVKQERNLRNRITVDPSLVIKAFNISDINFHDFVSNKISKEQINKFDIVKPIKKKVDQKQQSLK